MALSLAQKTEVIKQYQKGKSDTGSPEVQVALLTTRINTLTLHLKSFPKDLHSQHGLILMVSKRRRLLNYLKKIDVSRYKTLIESLKIRR